MSPDRYWILIIAAVICLGLSIAGGLMYPLNARGIFEIIVYEIGVIIVVIGLFYLIYERGPPDEVIEARKISQSD